MTTVTFLGRLIVLDDLARQPTASQVFTTLKMQQSVPAPSMTWDYPTIADVPRHNGMISPSLWFRFTSQDVWDGTKIRLFAERNRALFFCDIVKRPYRQSQFLTSSGQFDFHKLKHGFVLPLDEHHWVEVGQYNTVRLRTGQGVVDGERGYTYMRAVLHASWVPYIRLDAVDHGMVSRRQTKNREDLEGDFSNYFHTYIDPSYASDLRYVLTPDVMVLLIDRFAGCDIEISGGCLFVVCSPAVDYSQMDEMEVLLQRFDALYCTLDQRLSRLNLSGPLQPIEPPSTEKLPAERSVITRFWWVILAIYGGLAILLLIAHAIAG